MDELSDSVPHQIAAQIRADGGGRPNGVAGEVSRIPAAAASRTPGLSPGRGSSGLASGTGADVGGLRGPWWALTWLSLAVAGLVGMAEVGAVVQEVTPTGQYPVTALYGPGQLTSLFRAPTATLNAWALASVQFGHLPSWLYAHLALDLVFIAGYGLLGVTVLPKRATVARWLLFALIAADIAEDAIAAAAFGWVSARRDVPAWVAWPLHVATVLKWGATVAFVVWVAYQTWDSPRARKGIRDVLRALKEQRFSLVIVALLGIVAAARGGDVLEQMPDVQRAWFTPPGTGWVHLIAAAAAQLLVALLLIYLGRLRTRRAEKKFNGYDRRRDPRYLPWLLPPIALIVLAFALQVTGAAEISWYRVLAVTLVIGGITAASALIAWRHKRSHAVRGAATAAVTAEPPAGGRQLVEALLTPRPEKAVTNTSSDDNGMRDLGHDLPARQPDMVGTVRTAGDVLAVAVIAVTGLGLVRSFTAPALIAGGAYAWASWAAVVTGIAVAAGVWVPAHGPVRKALRRLANGDVKTGPHPLWRLAYWASRGKLPGADGLWPRLWPRVAIAAPLVVVDGCLIFAPLWTTHWLGVLGTTVVAFGTLALGLAVLAYLAQTRLPLPLFRALRLNVTPVITLIVIIGVIGTALDKNSLLHRIRGPAAVSATGAPGGGTDLAAGLQAWLKDPYTRSCAVPGGGSGATGEPVVRVEPLVLVAAAGGGIRAAWWAARALETLAASRCGRHAVFAVSSVSGGSVGLAVMATTAKAGRAMARIAGPDALAAAIDGLLLRDMIAGFSGLDLPAAQMPSGQRFPDRAALMEHAWENDDNGLSMPFPLRRPALPWRLLFNSTAVGTGCRAIIADRPISGGAGPSPSLTCDLGSAAPAGGSYDFFAALPCMKNIDTSTAALLSARFPYITPSGLVTGCGRLKGVPVEQFVDGGYADSSGLSTLADLAPSLMALVRLHNAAALNSTPAGQPVTLVVPVTVYLGNSARPEPVYGTAVSTPELTVPTHAKSVAVTSQLTGSDAILQGILAATGPSQWLPCAQLDTRCNNAQAAAASTVPNQLIFVSPRTEPRIAAPLGWILSRASRQALDSALQKEQSSPCKRHTKAMSGCPVGVGRMADLLLLIPDHPPVAPAP